MTNKNGVKRPTAPDDILAEENAPLQEIMAVKGDPEVDKFLDRNGLGEYRAVFAKHQISWQDIEHMTDDHLKEMQLPIGHRLRARTHLDALTRSRELMRRGEQKEKLHQVIDTFHNTCHACACCGCTARTTGLCNEKFYWEVTGYDVNEIRKEPCSSDMVWSEVTYDRIKRLEYSKPLGCCWCCGLGRVKMTADMDSTDQQNIQVREISHGKAEDIYNMITEQWLQAKREDRA
eukprot:TRINITY_DN75953_c0_g1_i1.p1 TRINITY_DN75953_c0_g1~~TRINITY_DN75953_c0_g1_i1.p1  ORF type:complete len:233 (-),score=61.68 TRINITY_DN75953_c0_g1_i1:56-754(-)